MEHFAGGTVADRLRERPRRSRARVALRWLRETAIALDCAHGHDVVHRDVKPGNLLLDDHGRLAVGDFGIATVASEASVTQTGQVLGTAAYISPEQARGLRRDGRERPLRARRRRLRAADRLAPVRRATTPPRRRAPTSQAEIPAASDVGAGLPPAVDAVLRDGLAKDPGRAPAERRGPRRPSRGRARRRGHRRRAAADGRHAADRRRPARHRRGRRRGRAPPRGRRGARGPLPPLPTTGARPPARLAADAARPRPASGSPRRPPPCGPSPGPGAGRRSPPSPRCCSSRAPSRRSRHRRQAAAGRPSRDHDDGRAHRRASARTSTSTRRRRRATSTTSTATQAQSAPAHDGDDPAGRRRRSAGDPAGLNDRGFALLQQGNPAAAVPLLQQSVARLPDAGPHPRARLRLRALQPRQPRCARSAIRRRDPAARGAPRITTTQARRPCSRSSPSPARRRPGPGAAAPRAQGAGTGRGNGRHGNRRPGQGRRRRGH